MNDWEETTLEENISVIAMGPFGSNLKRDMFTEKGVPIIKGTNLSGMYVDGDFTFVSEDKATSLRKAIAYPNDIIITHRGTIGQVSLVPQNKYERYVTSQSQLRFSCDPKKLDYKYILYFLKSRIGQYELLKSSSQVGVPAIATPTKSIKEINLFLPSIAEQKAIANILTAFDDKMELLQQQNTTLETIAQTIFKEWFGKYQIGDDLPDGWREYDLGYVTLMSAGGDKPKNVTLEPSETNKIPIYSNGINNDGLYGYTDKPKVKEESVTVSARGTIGYVSLRMTPYVPIVRLITIIPNNTYLSSKYLFYWLKTQNISGTGTTQQQLTVPDFKRTEIIIPRFELMNEFTKLVDKFYIKINLNNSQILSLIKTRDALLPKLMSGQIRVKM